MVNMLTAIEQAADCKGVHMMINPGRNSSETQQSHLTHFHTRPHDQYFEFTKSNFTGTGMKGLVRGVQKWPWNQVPSNPWTKGGLGTLY